MVWGCYAKVNAPSSIKVSQFPHLTVRFATIPTYSDAKKSVFYSMLYSFEIDGEKFTVFYLNLFNFWFLLKKKLIEELLRS